MARQESEVRVVPEGVRKDVPTRGVESRGGGKAGPVSEEAWQPGLPFATAEGRTGRPARAEGKDAADRSAAASFPAPKPRGKERRSTPATTMEEVAKRLDDALERVASNRGAPGPDRQSVAAVRRHWTKLRPALSRGLLDGSYRPGDIRRVWIPKSGGGQRGLGIPNVVDRVVQEAVRSVLEPLYEPTFHASSHGFRPGRSCHTAIAEARRHLADGNEWVVDLDLEKFFDRVHHQRLMARLAERVGDKRLLVLIGQMLKAKVVMPDGVKVGTEEGVPQGGPLSPLLSNIVLDELDSELARRGHRFVRYADDCNIYVRSERAGQRVMSSVRSFIERRLRLKVNEGKSAVARPEGRHFLGFRLRRQSKEGRTEVLLSERSKKRLAERVVELTPRNWGDTLDACIAQVNGYLRGWLAFFGICTDGEERTLHGMDAHIRRRLRAVFLRQCKRKRSIARRLIAMGGRRRKVWEAVYRGRQSLWAMSHLGVVHSRLNVAYFTSKGLFSLETTWKARWQPAVVAPGQLSLPWGKEGS